MAERYLGMTRLDEPLERRLLGLSRRSLLTLVNERLEPSRTWNKWLDADTIYTIVQEVAKRWADRVEKLLRRVVELEAYDQETPPPAPAVKEQSSAAPGPEPRLVRPRAPKAESSRVERPKGRTLKQAFYERFAAGDTDEQAWMKVKAEFNLPDSKKGYAKWYRNDMAKKGGK